VIDSVYRIVDEPRPAGWARLAVDPVWPLFAFMFAGTWLSWLWFAVNGAAVGSPTRRREGGLVLGGIAGSVVIAFVAGSLMSAGVLGPSSWWVGQLALVLWKLGITYWLFELQRRSFELYRYFGGTLRSGIPIVVLGYLLRSSVIDLMPYGLWAVIVM
jgi:hypothetical protein